MNSHEGVVVSIRKTG